MTYTVLFTIGILALVEVPPFTDGECFRVGAAGANDGVYLAEEIISIPDGNYPPSDGSPGCLGDRRGAGLKTHLWRRWVVCTTPSPTVHAGTTGVTLEVVACPGVTSVFTDGFESGDTSRWSSSFPFVDEIFADGFESGDLGAWSGAVLDARGARPRDGLGDAHHEGAEPAPPDDDPPQPVRWLVKVGARPFHAGSPGHSAASLSNSPKCSPCGSLGSKMDPSSKSTAARPRQGIGSGAP